MPTAGSKRGSEASRACGLHPWLMNYGESRVKPGPRSDSTYVNQNDRQFSTKRYQRYPTATWSIWFKLPIYLERHFAVRPWLHRKKLLDREFVLAMQTWSGLVEGLVCWVEKTQHSLVHVPEALSFPTCAFKSPVTTTVLESLLLKTRATTLSWRSVFVYQRSLGVMKGIKQTKIW